MRERYVLVAMTLTRSRKLRDARTFGAGSAGGTLLGVVLIVGSGPILTTLGALTVILGAVSLLFAVGLSLDDPVPAEHEHRSPD